MELKKGILAGCMLLAVITGCEEDWDKHYGTPPPTVDQNLWEAIQEDENLSSFAAYIKAMKFDTLFLKNATYTLFIPDNNAFQSFTDTGNAMEAILNYHISPNFVQLADIKGKRKLQTLGEKFVLLERSGNLSKFDEIPVSDESLLYINGKYYTIGQVAAPKPNLYEFFSVQNPVLTQYIDDLDSIILDKELSRPVGFDEEGNTIYDTVSNIYNEFEEFFFPVREEFRSKTATLVFPYKENYNNALSEMASALGDLYTDYRDIPRKWQYDVLIPYLLKYGVFQNMLEQHEFLQSVPTDTVKLKNIVGDSVIIDYVPVDKQLCSNGYAYNYQDFSIPDTLFTGSTRFEGEWLLKETGVNKFAWIEEVKVITNNAYAPLREYVGEASNDSILRVIFQKGYTGQYSVSFKVENLLPRKYLMLVRTHMYVGGLYEVYGNDELIATIDYYSYVKNRELWWSVTGSRYRPEGAYNKWDCWFINTADYGETNIRLEYKGPSNVLTNGLVIDYIDFIPYAD